MIEAGIYFAIGYLVFELGVWANKDVPEPINIKVSTFIIILLLWPILILLAIRHILIGGEPK